MKMRWIVPIFALAAILICKFSDAQELGPVQQTLPAFVVQDQGKDKDKGKQPPDKKKDPETKAPDTDMFTRAPTMGNEFPTGFNPHMLGDFGTYFVRRTIFVNGTTSTTKTNTTFIINPGVPPGVPPRKIILATNTTTIVTPFTQAQTVLVPFASSAGAFKIAENESPRPTDRVFVTGNYFGAIRSPDTGGNNAFLGTTTDSNVTVGRIANTQVDTTSTVFVPGAPRLSANAYREMFGFEKTFLDGNASLEVRMPFTQQFTNVNGFGSQNAGDLTIIGRYAPILDNTTGNVFTVGLAVTAPTGPGINLPDGYLHSTLIQPWVGYIVNGDRVFMHAFHAVVLPTDPRDITLLFNDVGLNYWLYRGNGDRLVNFVVPMVEAHVTTPLNHRSPDASIYVPDVVVMTGGFHLGVGRSSILSIGVATPVTGPRIFNVEAFAQLNYRF